MSEKTIFKKIIDEEIPASKVYENESVVAFLDISPVSFGHTLVIPKKEYVWIQDMPDDELATLFIEAKKVLKGIKQALSCDYVQISVVGKDVPHVHVHLIPRYFDDELSGWQTKKYTGGQMQEYTQKIKSAL